MLVLTVTYQVEFTYSKPDNKNLHIPLTSKLSHKCYYKNLRKVELQIPT